MATILLIIIYIAFISLGLPDTVLGVVWPDMIIDFNLEGKADQLGYVSLVVTIGTVLSGIFSGYLINKLGTWRITIISIFLVTIALFGISIIPSFYWLLLTAIPLGLGAGSIDAALNNYVSLHYKAHHMNWLHAFWGVGATLGPIIIGTTLTLSNSWRDGFFNLGLIEIIILAILIGSAPFWKIHIFEDEEKQPKYKHSFLLLKDRKVQNALLIFLLYCAIEFTVGLWGSSYLYFVKNVSTAVAAGVVASYYGGITFGRFASGFITLKLRNHQMIILGLLILSFGTVLLLSNKYSDVYLPYTMIGVGLSPIFPAMMHETPRTFGKANSQYIIGFQMAAAYIGSSLFPLLFGVVANAIGFEIYPVFIALLTMFLLAIYFNYSKIKYKKKAN